MPPAPGYKDPFREVPTSSRLLLEIGAVSAAANHGAFTKYELWVILKCYVNYTVPNNNFVLDYFGTFSKVVHKY